jgi:type IV pilus assembly protein PilA
LQYPIIKKYIRKAHYLEIVQAATPYKLAVTECYYTLGDLKECHSGKHGIEKNKNQAIGNIQSIQVHSGTITIIPAEKNGLTSEDTYVLKPIVKNNLLVWESSGGGVIAGYTR